MLKSDLGRTYGHFIDEPLLKRQADALGMEIVFGYSGRDDYEEKWREKLAGMMGNGVSMGVFGDIDLEAHYTWIERVMLDMGLGMAMPLWGNDRKGVVDEFMAKGDVD